jgi:hypothetical protein
MRPNGEQPCIDALEALHYLEAHPDIAAINAHIEVKTQTKPIYRRGSHYLCKSCQRRMGGVVHGDLELRCQGCGKPQKFYSHRDRLNKPSTLRY